MRATPSGKEYIITKTRAMESYTLSFVLQNGEVGQLSPDVIMSSNDPRYRIAPFHMVKGENNQAPMLIAKFTTCVFM